ncbi:MAPEG family protein [Arenimonas sp.]|uniref:MAPEG family protein n=1 Tax=Arenimonas sp. TaxID=1872635 RepID=UPI002E2F08A1|nr:MAPEG family protein [Arenimonas sp.]HEX4854542.1 MAPEG family protein [Arenimonas sp.]
MHPLIALVTLLTIVLMIACTILVGRARGKYKILAPATTGHEGFERAFRVQMNTQEGAIMFLPTLWLAAYFGNPEWAALAGAVWLAGRIWYAAAYAVPGRNRGPGFAISLLALAVLLVMAAWGVIWTLLLAG